MRLDKSKLPQHVAIIMDGNRRWAKKKGLAAIGGHNYVVDEVIEPIVDRAIELQIPYLTLWAFSTENFSRERREVEGLMKLFRRALERKMEDLHKKGVKLKMIGDLSGFPNDIEEKAREWMKISKDNTKITVTFALNYGGRDEIVRAVQKIVFQSSGEKKKIDEKLLSSQLDTGGMPDVDLLIRPGGEKRLSGFMMWQSVYAELYFTDVLMPELTIEEFEKALEEYGRRNRRFGRGKFSDYKS